MKLRDELVKKLGAYTLKLYCVMFIDGESKSIRGWGKESGMSSMQACKSINILQALELVIKESGKNRIKGERN